MQVLSTDPRPVSLASRRLALDEALALLGRNLAPGPRTVPITEAQGLVLARPLIVPQALPATAIALRQGYAVPSGDLIGASPFAPAYLLARPVLLAAGEPLPADCDCVLDPEDVVDEGGLIAVGHAAGRWQNIRRVGEDAERGTVLAPAGTVVRPPFIAAAQACGITRADCHDFTVTITPGDGAWAAVADLVTALLRGAGMRLDDAAPLRLGPLPAPGEGLAVAVEGCAEVRLVPPAAAGDPWAIALPPLTSVALSLALGVILPLCDALTGRDIDDTAPLTRRIASPVGLAEPVLLRQSKGGFEPVATGLIGPSALASATHRALIPAGSEGLAAGAGIGAFRL
jgi:molybdopterin molybdotransferase